MDPLTSRRRLLRYLAASPLLAGWPAPAQESLPLARSSDPIVWAPRALDRPIDNPQAAMSVFDFEPVMRQTVPPAHFGYMATGIDDEACLRANRDGFQRFQLRPRRLVDVSRIDQRTEILGATWDSPVVLAPTGSNRAFHAEGEVAVAKAAKPGNHLQILSTVATTSIEAAIEARGAPLWFQLYATQRWEVGEAMAKRAERAGAPAIVLTLDVLARQNWETLARLRRSDSRACGGCHGLSMRDFVARKPMFDGLDLAGVSSTIATNMTWDLVRRLRDATRAKLVLKGILAPEDARLAAASGVDAIIVSNHGGRADDGVGSTIEALPEILAAAGPGLTVLVDSGFRRGTDVVKALALGARAVCVGRPYLWGLGAFGQAGVERVLELLRLEIRAAMQQVGAPTIKDLTPAMVRRV